MKIKFIAIDMDGTLLNSKHEISTENKEAIQQAIDSGIHVAICTGRMYASASKYAQLIGLKVPVICSNGGYIREPDNDKILYEQYLPKEDLVYLLENLDHGHTLNDGLLFFNSPEIVYTMISESEDVVYRDFLNHNSLTKKVEICYDTTKEDLLNEDTHLLKAIFICDDVEKVTKYNELFSHCNKFDVTQSWTNNIEINPKGVHKATGVKALAQYYNVKKEEIMCIGDSGNDKSMIEYAGLGVAMGNAREDIKAIAQYITDTNDANGVAKAITHYIK